MKFRDSTSNHLKMFSCFERKIRGLVLFFKDGFFFSHETSLGWFFEVVFLMAGVIIAPIPT